MKKITAKIILCSLIIFSSLMSGCSDKSVSKEELIVIYNEFSKNAPPAIGEGEYPLTANFTTTDKGKDGKAQALVDVGFLKPVQGDNAPGKKPVTSTDNIVTFYLTDQGKRYYDSNVKGFAWGYHSAFSASKLKIATTNGQKTAFVTLKTKIVNIPDWAKKPEILANYPIVKGTLDNNEFLLNAVYRFYNGRWALVEANLASK